MHALPRFRAFSLVEVVIAVAIFAVALSSILALLPSLLRQSGESADLMVAQRLPEPLRIELRRIAAGSGFGNLATLVPVMSSTPENGFALAATRDGSRVAAAGSSESIIGDDEQYFLIEAWRFNQAPLAYEPGDAVLALRVRVSWPYRLPGVVAPIALVDRVQFTFNTAINR